METAVTPRNQSSNKVIEIGKSAPAFSLSDQNGKSVSLKDFRDKKRVVLYFYPKAMTPGCTVQAQGIRDAAAELKKKKVVVLGISPDAPEKLKKFEDKEGLNFTLLSDPEHKVADKYGAWGPKKFMGKEFDGILRTTFIIGKNGKILHVMDKVKTKSHLDDVFGVLESLP